MKQTATFVITARSLVGGGKSNDSLDFGAYSAVFGRTAKPRICLITLFPDSVVALCPNRMMCRRPLLGGTIHS